MNNSILRHFNAFIFGALGVLAFSPFDFWPLALLSLSGLLYCIVDQKPKQALLSGFFWGFGLFIFGISWVYVSIQHFGGVSVPIACGLCALLAMYLALYPALFSYLVTKLSSKTTYLPFIFLAPALWLICEYIRGWAFTGFPWLQFGYTQLNGPLKSIAPIGGVDMITFILMTISALIIYSIKKKSFKSFFIAVVLLLSPLTFPIHWVKSNPEKTLNVALVQGNIEQSIKWSPEYLDSIISTYIRLTLPLLDKNDVVIWPEAAIPDIERRHQDLLIRLDQIARQKNSTIILGIMDYQALSNAIFNSAIVLGDKDFPYDYSNTNRYNKHYLVPFGEMIPFHFLFSIVSAILDFPMSTLTPGNYIQSPITAQNAHFLMAICYEVIKGNQLRKNLTKDTDFILTISNDAWFGSSIGPWQHFQMARMRALELGRPLIRSTNNGITAIVNEKGDVVKAIPQFQETILESKVTSTIGITPYVHFGFILPGISTIAFFMIFVYLRKIRK